MPEIGLFALGGRVIAQTDPTNGPKKLGVISDRLQLAHQGHGVDGRYAGRDRDGIAERAGAGERHRARGGIRAYLVVYYSALVYGFAGLLATSSFATPLFFSIAGEGFGLHQGVPMMAEAIAAPVRGSPSHPALARSAGRKRLPDADHHGIEVRLPVSVLLTHQGPALSGSASVLERWRCAVQLFNMFPTVLVQIGWTLRGAGAVLSSAHHRHHFSDRLVWGGAADRFDTRLVLGVMGMMMDVAILPCRRLRRTRLARNGIFFTLRAVRAVGSLLVGDRPRRGCAPSGSGTDTGGERCNDRMSFPGPLAGPARRKR